MNQVLAAMLLLTVMLQVVALLRTIRLLSLRLRQSPTTEAAPSGAASVGLPAPADGVRIALNIQDRTQFPDESKHSLSRYLKIVANISPSSSLNRTTDDFQERPLARPSTPPAPPGGAERKLVTVLVVDVDETREGFAEVDPEDAGRLLPAHLARVRAEVEGHGGVVEETLGGRTVALFGVPRTRDDDPERAVRAALAIRDALTGGGEPGPEPGSGVRVHAAVATGEALVRAGGGAGRPRVAGDPVGAAARLLETVPVGAVLVSETTRRAVERAIAFGPVHQGPPGGREPPAWPALAPRAGPASPSRRFPPLVARDRELATLLAAADDSRRGVGPRLVTMVGPAGIGKTRLLAELADRLTAERQDPRPVAWRQGRALPYGDGPTFGALAEAVKAEAGILESDGAELAGRRLAAAAATVAEPVTAAWVAGHLRRLVGVGAGGPGTGGSPTTAADREEEFAAWRRFLHGLAATRPLVLALEDLHRADDALLDFVEGLADTDGGRAAILVLATARPELLERRPGWGAGGTTIRLEPLGAGDTTGLLATLLHHHGLPTEVDPARLGRGGGNPRVAEEYVRMLRDRGPATGGTAAAVPLPTGVHAIVAARLDALPAADKAVLHDAAVLGQVGWLGALAEITGRRLPDLAACLERLEAREFLARAPASRVAGEVEYGFRHTLVREVAYGQVLRAERADKHRRAAAWIEGLVPDRAEGRAELLAYHYRAALSFARAAGTEPPGLADRTLAALRDAGDRAAALGGWETAARFHAEALELCPEGDPARGRLLLRLGRARCRGEMAGQGELTAAREALLADGDPVAAAEAEMLLGELAFLQGRGTDREAALARALALVAGAPPSPTKAAVLRGAMMHLVVASRHAEGLAVGREVLSMARTLGLPELEADALGAIGTARVEAGDPGGLDDLEAAIARFDRLGTPGGTLWQLNLGWAAAATGDLARCFAALAAAARQAERFGSRRWRRAIELQRVAERYWTGRWAEAVAVVDALLAGGERHYLEWECRLWRGRIRLACGRAEDALADARAAHALAVRARDPQDLHPTRAFLARALLATGQRDEAAEVAGRLLAGLGGGVLGPDVGADLGMVMAELGIPAATLDRLGIPPTPWLDAARALAAGDPLAAADRYAAIGSRPEEADARQAAARLLVAQGRPAEAEAQQAAAAAFLATAG
jgi:class 3 adenylate cyclase/tetratricopeptide (TPR) repeat protein